MRFIATILGVFAVALHLALVGCVSTDHPAGVPRGIVFSVQPVYPNSYDIVAGGSRKFTPATMEDAWRKKAAQVAAGRKYRISKLVVHDTEFPSDVNALPMMIEHRNVSGTITILKP